MTAVEIRELRKLYDETQEEFARRCQVSLGTVQTWEQGRSSPTGPGAIKLREWLEEARAAKKRKPVPA